MAVTYVTQFTSGNEGWLLLMLHSSPVGMKDGCYLIMLHSSSPQDGINYAQFQQAKHAKYYQFGLRMSFDARCG